MGICPVTGEDDMQGVWDAQTGMSNTIREQDKVIASHEKSIKELEKRVKYLESFVNRLKKATK